MSNRETHDLAMTSSAPAKHYLAHVRRILPMSEKREAIHRALKSICWELLR
jgi:hypothetical protein